MKKVYIYDLEMFSNFHSGIFLNRDDPNDVRTFVIHKDRDDKKEYLKFLKENVNGLIGYNNLGFDYPLLHFFMSNPSAEPERMYKKSQKIICSEFPAIAPWKVKIPQLDLMKIWHFDNVAKMTSLKWIEFAIGFENVEDLPFHHSASIDKEDIDKVLDYNLNDVKATYELYKLTRGNTNNKLYKGNDKIKLRQDINKEFGINCFNYNDVKIGESINKKYYLDLTGKEWNDIKGKNTERKWITVKDLIPSYIKFNSLILSNFLEEIKDKYFMPHQKFERHINYADNIFKFAKGGLHTEDKPGMFIPKEDEELSEYDVASMYPAGIINGGIYPKHLGPEFLNGYKMIFDKRLKAKKNGNKVVNEALKLALNGGGYGKMGEKTSWMRDDLQKFKVTFAGQLSLLMLIEGYHENGIKVISSNTDGIVAYYKKSQQSLVDKINKEWEETTGYILEKTGYKKYIRRDVNNYLCLKEDDEVKEKGCFEIDKELHKNHSQRIIPIALSKYFLDKIPVEKTITEHSNILDFCKGAKAIGGAKFETWEYKTIGEKIVTKYGKVVRYYVSDKGKQLMKILPPLEKQKTTYTEKYRQTIDSAQMDIFSEVEDVKVDIYRESNVEAKHSCTVFNKIINKSIKEYDINYEYYIKECEKIIKPITKSMKK